MNLFGRPTAMKKFMNTIWDNHVANRQGGVEVLYMTSPEDKE